MMNLVTCLYHIDSRIATILINNLGLLHIVGILFLGQHDIVLFAASRLRKG